MKTDELNCEQGKHCVDTDHVCAIDSRKTMTTKISAVSVRSV